jgi:hypothetical protein
MAILLMLVTLRSLMALFKIYNALKEDVNQGWVWLGDSHLKDRSVVKLSVKATSKHVYCEGRRIDENFLNDYNEDGKPRNKIGDPQSALVVADWYRKRLGDLETGIELEIEVQEVRKVICGTYGRVRACLDHPQVVVRLATWLGLWGFGLGLIGVILGIIPLLTK